MKANQYVIDRVASGTAVLITAAGGELNVPHANLPAGAREGNVIVVRPGPVYEIDEAATAARQNEMQALRGSIPKGPSGDIDL